MFFVSHCQFTFDSLFKVDYVDLGADRASDTVAETRGVKVTIFFGKMDFIVGMTSLCRGYLLRNS
jgi:hypothetical protein